VPVFASYASPLYKARLLRALGALLGRWLRLRPCGVVGRWSGVLGRGGQAGEGPGSEQRGVQGAAEEEHGGDGVCVGMFFDRGEVRDHRQHGWGGEGGGEGDGSGYEEKKTAKDSETGADEAIIDAGSRGGVLGSFHLRSVVDAGSLGSGSACAVDAWCGILEELLVFLDRLALLGQSILLQCV
jgi:hypothetical protein